MRRQTILIGLAFVALVGLQVFAIPGHVDDAKTWFRWWGEGPMLVVALLLLAAGIAVLFFPRWLAGNRPLPSADDISTESDWEPLERAFKWVIEEGGVGSWMEVEEKAAPAIRQAAVAGTLQLRGYKEIARHGHGERFDNVRSDIPAEYWQTHVFDLTVTLGGGGHDKSQAETLVVGRTGAGNMPHYRGLQADMRQVKKLWP